MGKGHAAGIGIIVLAACGPAVDVPSDGEDGTADSGTPTTNETTTSASDDDGDSGSSGVFDEGSGSPPAFCGNGVVEGIEACDDGNDMDADGCSRLCEASGTVSWRVEFHPERGFGVGLDARDGEAYVLVQDYHQSLGDTDATSSRVSAQGEVVAQYLHPGALADFDLAREAIASMPGGEVIVGYPAPDGALFRVQLDAGPVWSDPMDTWRYSAATRWLDGEVHTLRRAADSEDFAVLRFTDAGELLETQWLGSEAIGARPLSPGAIFPRGASRLVVLLASEGGAVQVHTSAGGSWDSVEVGAPSMSPPRAFLHATFEIVIWTDTERIVVDVIDHAQPPQPRVVDGLVLVSFTGGFAISANSRIDVYDDAGGLRWSHEAPAIPRLAMVDGLGGVFVLSDAGEKPDGTVILERLVL